VSASIATPASLATDAAWRAVECSVSAARARSSSANVASWISRSARWAAIRTASHGAVSPEIITLRPGRGGPTTCPRLTPLLVPGPAGRTRPDRDQLAQGGRTVNRQRTLSAPEIEGLEQAEQAQPVVGVEVGQEHLVEVGEPDRADQLALSPLPAVEQDAVGAAAHQQARQAARSGWNRA